jgi:hypothetical protein
MTESPENRRADALSLLQAILFQLSDAPIDCTLLDPSSAAYSAFRNTSWDELVLEGLLLELGDSQYVLTSKGWAEAIARSAQPSRPEFLQRLGQLAGVLKEL